MSGQPAARDRLSTAAEHEGTALFLRLAGVVAGMAERERLRTFTLPYPRDAQLALDHTVAYCLARGHAPPKSVPALMGWCRRHTAGGELFQVPSGLVPPDTLLIDPFAALPSRSCWELASIGPEGYGEREASRLLGELAERCRTAEAYQRCRRYLMEQPVVVQRDRVGLGRRSRWNRELWSRVKHLYAPVPEQLTREKKLILCGTCGLPSLTTGDGSGGTTSRWCEGERCPPDVPERRISAPGRALLLRRSLRIFLALPGRTERVVLDDCARAGIPHQFLATGLGGHRFEDTCGRSWAVRIDDRRQPAALASSITAASHDPPVPDLAVVPAELSASPTYRSAFDRALAGGPCRHTVLTDPEGLLSRLRHGAVPPDKEKNDA